MIKRNAEMKTEVREKMRGGEGAVTIRHLFDKSEIKAKTRLCSRISLPPGASIGTHTHENEDELFVIIGGTGVVDDGISKTRVNAGDATLTASGESHSISNDGTVPLDIVAIIMCY